MKRIKSVVAGGKRCRVEWKPLRKDWGLASGGLIEMDSRIDDTFTAAEILLHEMIHIQCPDMSEEKVEQMARELATAMKRAGLLDEDEQ